MFDIVRHMEKFELYTSPYIQDGTLTGIHSPGLRLQSNAAALLDESSFRVRQARLVNKQC